MKSLENCIFICFATLETLIIIYLYTTNSVAYCDGLVWICPIILLAKPVNCAIKYILKVGNEKSNEQ